MVAIGRKKGTTFLFLFPHQIKPGGESIESSFRVLGLDNQFTSTGAVGFTLSQWNCLISTYDGTAPNLLNGKLVGAMPLSQTPQNDDGNLGVGGSPDGSNLFKGWIDEIRFYATHWINLMLNWHTVKALVIWEPLRSLKPMPPPMKLSHYSFLFANSDGLLVPVSDFLASDLEVSGGSVSSFTELNATHFQVGIRADKKPQRIKIRIPAGVAKDDENFFTSFASTRVNYLDQITGADSLVGWWKFDQALPIVDGNWSPTTLNPSLWLDAADETTVSHSSNSVNQWSDKVGTHFMPLNRLQIVSRLSCPRFKMVSRC